MIIIFLEHNEICIPKLGNQKFSTLSELLQEQDDIKMNISHSSMF